MAERERVNKTPIRVGFYDIERTIGKGNFAVVKLARHRITKTEVRLQFYSSTFIMYSPSMDCSTDLGKYRLGCIFLPYVGKYL